MTGWVPSHTPPWHSEDKTLSDCRAGAPGLVVVPAGLLGSWLCLPGLLGALVPPAGVVGAAAAGVGTTPPHTPPLCLIV